MQPFGKIPVLVDGDYKIFGILLLLSLQILDIILSSLDQHTSEMKLDLEL